MVCEPFLLFNAILHVYALTFSPILSLKVVRTEIRTHPHTRSVTTLWLLALWWPRRNYFKILLYCKGESNNL